MSRHHRPRSWERTLSGWVARAGAARRAATLHPRTVGLASLTAGLGVCGAPLVVCAGLALACLLLPGRWLPVACAVLLVAGTAGGSLRRGAILDGPLPDLRGRTIVGDAVVLEPAAERLGGVRAIRVRLVGGPAAGETAVARLPATVRVGGTPSVGEVLALRGVVAPLGRGDAYARLRGATATLRVRAGRRTGRRRGGLLGGIDRVRDRAQAALSRGMRPGEAALGRGMVLGDDSDLDEDTAAAMRSAGLSHLTAASGQNVALLASLAVAVGTVLGLGLRLRLALALALVVAYVPLAGAGPSIVRAGVMGTAGLLAGLSGRPGSRIHAVLLAAALTLGFNPLAIADVGWQLSFAAVVALGLLAQPLDRLFGERLGLPMLVAEPLAITLAATVGTAPLLVAHFGELSVVSPLANVVVAPAVAPIMWLGTVSAAMGQIAPGLCGPVNVLMSVGLAFVEQVGSASAALPGASRAVADPGPVMTAMSYGALLAGCCWLRGRLARPGTPTPGPLLAEERRRRWGRLAPAACLAGALLLAAASARAGIDPDGPAARVPGELVVSFLDVGQGDATLLQRDGVSVLVDTGPPDGPILTRLAEAGVGRLDLLVVTHAEADHEGGAAKVVARHPAAMVLDGASLDDTAVQRALHADVGRSVGRLVQAQAGQRFTLDGLRIDVLSPSRAVARRGPRSGVENNDRAAVVVAVVGGFRLLLTADAESPVTSRLPVGRVTALKVAHHGSDNPGLPEELGTLRPELAVVSVGAGNTYGHPTDSTMAALGAVPVVRRTDRDGTVRLHVRNGRAWLER